MAESKKDQTPKSIAHKLLEIQRDLKVEKGQYNQFGKYNYRSKEDILEAVKPLCHERGLIILVDDEIVVIAEGWVYARSCAILKDVETDKTITARGWSREPEEKKGADASQITGMAASYAGKRALSNLFAIDDTKDADDPATSGQAPAQVPAKTGIVAHCLSCGKRYSFTSKEHLESFIANPGCCPEPSWAVDKQ
ncbi:MAG: ERF family protein [Atopobiaceae bacterium]|nr:ERF family protein [Atopobiaceae bacterium]